MKTKTMWLRFIFPDFTICLILLMCSAPGSGRKHAVSENSIGESSYAPIPIAPRRTAFCLTATALRHRNSNIPSPVYPMDRLEILSDSGNAIKVKAATGKIGYISKNKISTIWIKVWKKEHRLMLMRESEIVKTWPIALGFNPIDDKVQQGDGCTPEGRFYLCEMLEKPQPPERYGARSMRLSYPCSEDARRGLRDELITRKQYSAIIAAMRRGIKPPQNTKLGGSIRIHGGGAGTDWTLGCIALDDRDIIELYAALPKKNTTIEVYKSAKADSLLNRKHYTNETIVASAKQMYADKCRYTSEATAIIPISFPFGDFKRNIGVCTDVVIRALRPLGIDLQSFLHEDIINHPKRYPKIGKPTTSIDHRRTRNLKLWFDHHAVILTNSPPDKRPDEWLPGDIVLMDTGIKNGTIYDHIGIVSDEKTNGRYAVINLWTIGYTLEAMDLLDGTYPTIVGHYRMLHPLDYGTFPLE